GGGTSNSETIERPCVVPISAPSRERLKELAITWRNHFLQSHGEGEPKLDLQMVALSAARRRTHHSSRLAITCACTRELADYLGVFLRDEFSSRISAADLHDASGPVFVFPGHENDWTKCWDTFQALSAHPRFREHFEACEELMSKYMDKSI